MTQDAQYAATAAGVTTALAAPVATDDYSALGARIWITSNGEIAYDTSSTRDRGSGGRPTVTDSFVYAIRMGNGTLSWTTVTVQVTGSNDAPVLSGVTTAPQPISELAGATGVQHSDASSAHFTFTDPDLIDTHHVSVSTASAVWSGGSTLPAGLQAALNAALSTSLTDSTHSGAGSVGATFWAADKTFDFLAAGETLTVTYDVTVTDNSGANSIAAGDLYHHRHQRRPGAGANRQRSPICMPSLNSPARPTNSAAIDSASGHAHLYRCRSRRHAHGVRERPRSAVWSGGTPDQRRRSPH